VTFLWQERCFVRRGWMWIRWIACLRRVGSSTLRSRANSLVFGAGLLRLLKSISPSRLRTTRTACLRAGRIKNWFIPTRPRSALCFKAELIKIFNFHLGGLFWFLVNGLNIFPVWFKEFSGLLVDFPEKEKKRGLGSAYENKNKSHQKFPLHVGSRCGQCLRARFDGRSDQPLI